MTNDKVLRFTFRMPKLLSDKLRALSNEMGVSLNALILQILWEWANNKTG